MQPKYLILFFFFALSCAVKAQQLPEGTYIHSTGYTYTEFTFKPDSRFSYKFSSCTGGKEGSGTYTFKNKKLLLAFTRPENKITPLIISASPLGIQNDTSYLSFKFFDQKDTNVVEGVDVIFLDKRSGITYGTRSNNMGEAKLKITNELLPLKLEITRIGIDRQFIKLDTAGNYSFVFNLDFEFIKPFNEGDILRFKVGEFNNEKLVLKPLKEKKYWMLTRKSE